MTRPSDLLGLDDSARFEHLHVLDDRSERHRPEASADSLTEAGPEVSRSTMVRRLLSANKLERPIEVDRLLKHLLECMQIHGR